MSNYSSDNSKVFGEQTYDANNYHHVNAIVSHRDVKRIEVAMQKHKQNGGYPDAEDWL